MTPFKPVRTWLIAFVCFLLAICLIIVLFVSDPLIKPPNHIQSSYERVSRGSRWSDPDPDGVHSRQQPHGQPGPPDVQAGQGQPGGSLVTGSQAPAWGAR